MGDVAKVVVKHSLFHNNTSVKNGGTIFVNDSASCSIASTVVSSNFAAGMGGGFCLLSSARVQLLDSNVTGNRADLCGGICVADSSQVHAQGLLLKDNAASHGRGACVFDKGVLHLLASKILFELKREGA